MESLLMLALDYILFEVDGSRLKSMDFVSLIFSSLIILIFLLGVKVVFPPWNFPNNIPTIPFYVIFLPTLFGIDQIELYELYLREPLEKYGAVKIFFGARWNILVSKPTLLAQMFKDENTFAKSGNHKKIPYSVLSAYTGDNVISAHGETWRAYRNAVTNGMQHFEEEPLHKNAKLFTQLIGRKTMKGATISVGPLVQRLTLDNIADVMLGFDFNTLTEEHNSLHEHLLGIKRQIFHPFFMTFPFFDTLPLPARRRAFKDVQSFREVLVKRVKDKLVTNYKFEQTSFPSSDLIRAYNHGSIDYEQLTDNIVIILVAGHENPQMALTSILYLLAKYKNTWQKRIRDEIGNRSKNDELMQLPLLNSFIYEAIRFYPPLNTIINRRTTKACKLGPEIVIPKGTYVGYNNYSTTHNSANWGGDASKFQPERWGQDIQEINNGWRYAKTRCTMPSFHGGRRACLGEKYAIMQLRITLAYLLRKFQMELPSDSVRKLTPAGPLCPIGLKINFEEIV